MCPPFTARQRHLMLQISFLMTCTGILTHLACKARSRSRMLLTSWRSLTRRRKWSCKCSMGERSSDLAGHCNTLTLWMGKMPRTVWTGLIMLENPNVMLLQIRYNYKFDNSVTSVECQHRDGRFQSSGV